MAARLLSQIGPGHGALGLAYALTLGFGLVYLGEHYVIDLVAGLALVGGALARSATARPAGADARRGHSAARAAGGLMRTDDRRTRSGQDPDLHLRRRSSDSEDAGDAEVGAFQALLHDRRKLVSGLLSCSPGGRRHLHPVPEGRRASTTRWTASTKPRGTGSSSPWGSTLWRSAPTWRSSAACSAASTREVRRRLDWRASYQITMAGLAATRIFSAAGAGGIVLTYWALRKAGLPTPARRLPDGRLPRPDVRGLHWRRS